jgi:hypothetical protein
MCSVEVYRQNAHASSKYAASPIFVFAHEWLNLHTAYEIDADKRHPKRTLSMTHSLLPAEVIVVGVVSDTNLYCSPVGTFREDHPLHESKFELLLVRPDHQFFGPDYDLATKQLSIAQHSASPLVEPDGLLCGEGIKLSTKNFSPKVNYFCCLQVFS